MPARPPYAVPSTYNTKLNQLDEMAFRDWQQKHGPPFDPAAAQTDYDLRGFYQRMMQGDPLAKSSRDPYDKQMHYPDYWKTPEHRTYSRESQWADDSAGDPELLEMFRQQLDKQR